MFIKWSEKPFFINEIGVKFWKDVSTDNYLHMKNHHNISLDSMSGYAVEYPNGRRAYLIVDNDKGIPIYESQQMEAIGTFIDILKADKHFNEMEGK